jgi:hypothetical protein
MSLDTISDRGDSDCCKYRLDVRYKTQFHGANWSSRIESLYYNLGQDTQAAAEGLTIGADRKFDGTLILVGLNRQL